MPELPDFTSQLQLEFSLAKAANPNPWAALWSWWGFTGTVLNLCYLHDESFFSSWQTRSWEKKPKLGTLGSVARLENILPIPSHPPCQVGGGPEHLPLPPHVKERSEAHGKP